jgi:PAS domain S-box-containing protein
MMDANELLEALPVAVYTTDADGRITFYNAAAAELWGNRPELGSDKWCGSWRLYWPDGRPMRHDECPMAISLKEGRAVRGMEAVAERPDGSRVPFIPYPTPLKDASGKVIGAINLLMDISEQKHGDIESARLAAIVESSDDAIISKTLDGRITSWNAGATRIFGYEPEEMIGQSITRIIPDDLLEQEQEILAKLKRGERIDHFDTVRVRKDGGRIDISLTVSPLRDRAGNIVGASKVARDITERRRTEELHALLFDELNHRVKNTLATIQAIASQSLRRAANPSDFVSSFNGRVHALARAHDLLVQGKLKGANIAEIVREQVLLGASTDMRISCSGPSMMLDARAAVHLALVLHELATNARKYGGLSIASGRLSISWSMRTDGERELFLEWMETGVPNVSAPTSHGFGTTLIERTLESNGGEASIRYGVDGISCEIRLPLAQPDQQSTVTAVNVAPGESKSSTSPRNETGLSLRGKRILVIEDEPLVAMDIESQLCAEGYEVVGPVGDFESAKRLIGEASFDAALLDVNLSGHPVDELAASLRRKAVRFAFATGYGGEALPLAFRDTPLLLKPFSREQLLATTEGLLRRSPASSTVVPLRHGKV